MGGEWAEVDGQSVNYMHLCIAPCMARYTDVSISSQDLKGKKPNVLTMI